MSDFYLKDFYDIKLNLYTLKYNTYKYTNEKDKIILKIIVF